LPLHRRLVPPAIVHPAPPPGPDAAAAPPAG
jgi:hypothetical protein